MICKCGQETGTKWPHQDDKHCWGVHTARLAQLQAELQAEIHELRQDLQKIAEYILQVVEDHISDNLASADKLSADPSDPADPQSLRMHPAEVSAQKLRSTILTCRTKSGILRARTDEERRTAIERMLALSEHYLAQARDVDVPARGKGRAAPMLRKRNLLRRAYAAARELCCEQWAALVTPDRHARALRILDETNAEWPLPQAHMLWNEA